MADPIRWRTERRNTVPGSKNKSSKRSTNHDDQSEEEMPGAFAVTPRPSGQRCFDRETEEGIQEEVDAEDIFHEEIDQSSPPQSSGIRLGLSTKNEWRKAFLFWTILGIFVSVIIVGAGFGINAVQRAGSDTSETEGQGIEETARRRFEECLMDGKYVSTRLTTFLPLVLNNVETATANAIVTAGSYQRSAFCWLCEVDEFFEPSFITESSNYLMDVLQLNERFALASLYYHWVPIGSLQTSRFSKSNWMSTSNVCDWDFVACFGPDHLVTGLSVEKVVFNTYLPREVAGLADLVDLKLTSCGLTGTIPYELFNLTKLETLDLSLNDLTGTIPSEFVKLLQVRQVDLSQNRFSGEISGPIFALPLLEYLFVWSNELTGSLPNELCNATSLVHLELDQNYDFSGTIPDLSKLVNLRALNLAQTRIKDSFPDFSQLTDLERLDFKTVNISGTIPAIFFSLPKLSHLDLFETRLTGSLPPALGLLTTLEYLDLAMSSFSGRIPTEMGNLSRLSILRLPSGLTGTFPTELGRLSNLTELDLSPGRKMSGVVPSGICNLFHGPNSPIMQIWGPCAPKCDCCLC